LAQVFYIINHGTLEGFVIDCLPKDSGSTSTNYRVHLLSVTGSFRVPTTKFHTHINTT
jgi:hypothetical protein